MSLFDEDQVVVLDNHQPIEETFQEQYIPLKEEFQMIQQDRDYLVKINQ